MSKIVLDEKEVNELMDTFDFNKSMYLKKLEEITISINKLDEIQKTQKEITDKLENYSSILSKFNFKNEQELTANYSSYLAFLSKKIDDLLKNENLKKLEKILDKTDYIVNLSVFKVAVIVAVITIGINFIILK
jgi:cysteinyl-tRNA synthetase